MPHLTQFPPTHVVLGGHVNLRTPRGEKWRSLNTREWGKAGDVDQAHGYNQVSHSIVMNGITTVTRKAE